MIRTALALLLAFAPADWPVAPPTCDPALGIVTDCVQPQLPEETTGRDISDGTDPVPAEPASPAPAAPSYTG